MARRGITEADVRKFVKGAVKLAADEAKGKARSSGRPDDAHETFVELAFEFVDDWWGANMGTGRIDKMDPHPTTDRDVKLLETVAVIFRVAIDAGWGVADDTGLWEGLEPFPALLSQAFFTLEQAITQQEPTADWRR